MKDEQTYRYTFTWSDGEVTTIEADGQWMAQNLAYARRFGLGGERTANIVSETHVQVSTCAFCDSPITLAPDGAWDDERGACGCGDGEHQPVESIRGRLAGKYNEEEDE